MSRYRLEYVPKVEKQLKRIPTRDRHRILKAIAELKEDPLPPGRRKIQGRPGERWRIRVGDYRIIYAI